MAGSLRTVRAETSIPQVEESRDSVTLGRVYADVWNTR
jgi:hypothetical protein